MIDCTECASKRHAYQDGRVRSQVCTAYATGGRPSPGLLMNICGAVVLSIALLRQGFPSVSFAGGIDIVLTLVLSESTTRDQRQQQQQQS